MVTNVQERHNSYRECPEARDAACHMSKALILPVEADIPRSSNIEIPSRQSQHDPSIQNTI